MAKYVVAKLEVAGDEDDGMLPVYTGCIHGNPPRQSTAIINTNRLLDEKPAENEFTQELRKICREEQKERQPFIEPQIVLEACSRLDAQQQRIEELEKDNAALVRFNTKYSILRQELEAQLAKRDEAIRNSTNIMTGLMQDHYSLDAQTRISHFMLNKLTRQWKANRRILGDQYKEIIDG